MKARYASVLLLSGLLVSACGIGSQQNTSKPSSITITKVKALNFARVQMFPNASGWALGSQQGTVYRTADGVNWENVSPANVPSSLSKNGFDRVLYAESPTNAWFVFPKNRSTLVIDHTSNGGKTWQTNEASHPVPNYAVVDGPVSMSFANALDGWIMVYLGGGMTQPGVLYRTTNGGNTWTTIAQSHNAGVPSLPFSGKISFTSAEDGWLTGSTHTTLSDLLYKTTDGGKTWTRVGFPIPSGNTAVSAVPSPPQFFNGVGVMPVWYQGNTTASYIYTTVDQGETWNYKPSVAFIHADVVTQTLMFASEGNKIYRSTSGATGFTSQGALDYNFRDPQVSQIDFINSTTGWAILMDIYANPVGPPVLLRTTNGGRTWSAAGFGLIKGAK